MKYYLFITGCQQNIYDSNRVAHLLEKMGYVLGTEKNANVIIVVACSVRQKPIDRIWGKFRTWLKRKPKPIIIVTGCLLTKDKNKMTKKIDGFVPADEIEEKLPQVLSRLFTTRSMRSTRSNRQLERAKRWNEQSDRTTTASYVPIMHGCNNFCTYCAVPYTRGREHSRPIGEIITEIKNLIRNGITEITLLGQNVNSYRETKKLRNKETKKQDFVLLLEQIEKIPDLKKISFLTCHPKDVGSDLIDWMSTSKKFSRELHLPLQSGNDDILQKMNRGYTTRQYFDLTLNLKSKIVNLKLTTDVIVGFPGETKKQFENTYMLCKKIGFDGAYISQFSPRPGTPAAKMKDDITPAEKKRRWLKLNNLINHK